MVEARTAGELGPLLERTSVVALRRGAAAATPVPTRFLEVADALRAHRAALEAGSVFPAVLLDRLIERLGA